MGGREGWTSSGGELRSCGIGGRRETVRPPNTWEKWVNCSVSPQGTPTTSETNSSFQ